MAGTLYQFQEGTLPLDVPGTWEDKTIHVLRMPGHGHATVSLVITRQNLPIGTSISGYTESELRRLMTSLPQFSERGRISIPWSDVAGEAVMARWQSAEGPVDQIIAVRPGIGQQVLIFTATHPTPMPSASYNALISAITGFSPRSAEQPTGA